jgi:hypothetical protein
MQVQDHCPALIITPAWIIAIAQPKPAKVIRVIRIGGNLASIAIPVRVESKP